MDYTLSLPSSQEAVMLLYVRVTFHRDKSRIIKQLEASNIQNLFCHETLHVSGAFCAQHQEISAVNLASGTFHAGYVAAV